MRCPPTEHPAPLAFLHRRFMIAVIDWNCVMKQRVTKQRDLDLMSIDELFMLHERVTATLATKISTEKEALADRLRQVETGLH